MNDWQYKMVHTKTNDMNLLKTHLAMISDYIKNSCQYYLAFSRRIRPDWRQPS